MANEFLLLSHSTNGLCRIFNMAKSQSVFITLLCGVSPCSRAKRQIDPQIETVCRTTLQVNWLRVHAKGNSSLFSYIFESQSRWYVVQRRPKSQIAVVYRAIYEDLLCNQSLVDNSVDFSSHDNIDLLPSTLLRRLPFTQKARATASRRLSISGGLKHRALAHTLCCVTLLGTVLALGPSG